MTQLLKTLFRSPIYPCWLHKILSSMCFRFGATFSLCIHIFSLLAFCVQLMPNVLEPNWGHITFHFSNIVLGVSLWIFHESRSGLRTAVPGYYIKQVVSLHITISSLGIFLPSSLHTHKNEDDLRHVLFAWHCNFRPLYKRPAVTWIQATGWF